MRQCVTLKKAALAINITSAATHCQRLIVFQGEEPIKRKTSRSHQLLVTVTVAVPETLPSPTLQRPVIVAIPAVTAVTLAEAPVF